MENNEQNELTDESQFKEEKKDSNNMKKKIADILTTVLGAALIALLLNWFVFSLIEVNQTSMTPTLNNKDIVFLTKISYWFSEPQSGDIIVFEREQANNSSINYVKRIIGIPGDTIEIRDGEVYRNGIMLNEPYIKNKTKGNYFYVIPEGKYYVMGDNRADSRDSRDDSMGLVDKDEIVGKVLFKTNPFGKIEKYVHSKANKNN